jgi:hypothetical protein
MKTLFVVAFYLAAFHVIYEMILAPSFRHILRFRLFAIRDRLRMLKFEHGHQLDAEVFGYVDESVTWQMNNQHRMNLSLLIDLPKIAEELRKDVDERLALMSRCQLPEFVQIRRDASKALMMAFVTNFGAWFIYIIPIALLVGCYDMIKEVVKKLLVMPERDLNKVAHGNEA